MQLILAIDSDSRRSEQLAALVHARLTVELVQATSAGEGLQALKDRVPDLILTSPLLSPFDEGVLDEYLRDLGAAVTHVQTVRIPMLSTGPRKKSAARRLFSLGRKPAPTSSAAPDGCDPKLFADEIAHYLTRSLEERTKTTTAPTPALEPEPAVPAVDTAFAHRAPAPDEWGAPEALVREFTEPIVATPEPIAPAPIVEETFVPGAILDLHPSPVDEPQVIVEPVAESPATLASAPAPPTMPSGTSASFEAALAAIRAAWTKPGDKSVEAAPTSSAQEPGKPRPLAGSGEVDLTTEVDALEDAAGVAGVVSGSNDEDSPNQTKAPHGRRPVMSIGVSA